jgi:FG-GAP-like repeat
MNEPYHRIRGLSLLIAVVGSAIASARVPVPRPPVGQRAARQNVVAFGLRHPAGDYTGDGRTDFAVVRPTYWYGLVGFNNFWIEDSLSGTYSRTFWGDPDFDVPVTGDFDGDGKADLAVYRTNTGINSPPPEQVGFYIVPSSTGVGYFVPFGLVGDDPHVCADYDGDGITDIAVYRAGSPSVWWYRSSLTGEIIGTPWGEFGDRPVPGDYDGDGRSDFAVHRDNSFSPVPRVYLIRTAAGAILTKSFGEIGSLDLPVPGDYDGDGITDLAIARRSGGLDTIWWILRSSDGGVTTTAWGTNFADWPIAGDFDGDGKSDIAVFRGNYPAGQSGFYVLLSSGGTLFRAWGESVDRPLTAFYY